MPAVTSTTILPPADSPNLALVHPTAQEILAQSSKNAEAWSGALGEEAYLRREEHLSDLQLTSNGGITFWVLVDTTQSLEERVVLSGCETLRKRALVTKDGHVTEIVCHGVGSVFTPVEYRGFGYGKRMIRELSAKLRDWQTERAPAMMSILYSDIGKKFYAGFGWIPYQSSHIQLPPISDSKPSAGYPTAIPLYDRDLQKLCAKDEALMHAHMKRWTGSTAAALVPDYKTIEWHHGRENFVSNELYGIQPPIKGAIVHVGEHRIWAIFSRVWVNKDPTQSKENALYILRLVVDGGDKYIEVAQAAEEYIKAIAAVLRVAQFEAHKWHCEFVETWNPKAGTVEAVRRLSPAATLTNRESEHIASMQWFGPESGVEWLENEKYGWC